MFSFIFWTLGVFLCHRWEESHCLSGIHFEHLCGHETMRTAQFLILQPEDKLKAQGGLLMEPKSILMGENWFFRPMIVVVHLFLAKKETSCILLSRDPIFFLGGLLVVHPSPFRRREISIPTTKPMTMQSICLTCAARFQRLGCTSHLSHLKFFVGFGCGTKETYHGPRLYGFMGWETFVLFFFYLVETFSQDFF